MRSLIPLTLTLILIGGCGEGSSSGGYTGIPITLPTYGAIAVNQTNGRAGITAKYDSQKDANSNALEQCGESCVLVLEFGAGRCGALARATTSPTFGWAREPKEYDAKVAALNQCATNNGVGCEVVLSKCND
jgi:hypothetical protein